MRNFLINLFLVCFVSTGAFAADWPQWRGPERNGISEEQCQSDWPEEGPKVLWRKSLGVGCSSVSTRDGKLYTMGNTDDVETVYCFDAVTGDSVWEFKYDCITDAKQFEGGPGATPALDGDYVYTFSRQGDLHCLNALTGEPVWSKNVQSEFGAKKPTWGFAGSAFIYGDLVVMNADAIIALDKSSGEMVWKTEPVGASYSTPSVATIEGKEYLATFVAPGLVLYDSETGEEFTRYSWKTRYDVNAATPIVTDNEIFISSGYNAGCALVSITDGTTEAVWTNKNIRNHFNSSVFYKDHYYGFDEVTLVCLDKATGEPKWKEKGLGKASLMLAGDKLVILSERGDAVIAKATSEGYQELARTHVLDNRCWVVPVLSNGLLYCKDNDGEMACLDLRKGE